METSTPCDVSVLGSTARTFTVEGHHFVLVIVDGLEPATTTEYNVSLNGEVVWPKADDPFPAPTIRTLGGRHAACVVRQLPRRSAPRAAVLAGTRQRSFAVAVLIRSERTACGCCAARKKNGRRCWCCWATRSTPTTRRPRFGGGCGIVGGSKTHSTRQHRPTTRLRVKPTTNRMKSSATSSNTRGCTTSHGLPMSSAG